MKLSTVQLEILVGRFSDWARPLMPEEQGPARNGFSPTKYWCALHQALFGPLTLREICAETTTHVSQSVMKVWRGEPEFKKAGQEAAQEFAAFLVREVLAEAGGDSLKRLVLSELLIMLPGFDIGRNEIIDKLCEIVKTLEGDATRPNEFKLLYDNLLCFRDVVRLARQYAKEPMKLRIEEKVDRAVSVLQDKIMALVKVGRENGTLDVGLVEAIGAVDLSLTFLASYSKIVV